MAKFSYDTSGFDDMINELNQIAEGVHELDGSQVSLEELFDDGFISLHTDFDSIDAFFSSSNVVVEEEEDLDALSI